MAGIPAGPSRDQGRLNQAEVRLFRSAMHREAGCDGEVHHLAHFLEPPAGTAVAILPGVTHTRAAVVHSQFQLNQR